MSDRPFWDPLLANPCAEDWQFGHASQMYRPEPVFLREKFMTDAMATLTDKPDWRQKVFDDEILAKWRSEVVKEPYIGSLPRNRNVGFSDGMFDFCIEELQKKAKEHIENDIVRVHDSRVAVAKSDKIVPEELRKSIQETVFRLLEDVPEEFQDWHPDSNNQVLNLVDPFLFPVIYGRSRYHKDGSVTMSNCLARAASGDIVPVPDHDHTSNMASAQSQWLPTEFEWTEHGLHAKSYINGIHPVHKKEMYGIVEKLIACALPLWNDILTYTRYTRAESELRFLLQEAEKAEYEIDDDIGEDHYMTILREDIELQNRRHGYNDGSPEFIVEDHYSYGEDPEHWNMLPSMDYEPEYPCRRRKFIHPEPRRFSDWEEELMEDLEYRDLVLDEFKGKSLQIIVKFTSIILTPENPTYAGGSWHVEGMLNERICATALYCYDSENITSSHLSFKTCVDDTGLIEEFFESDDRTGLDVNFGAESGAIQEQHIGSILTRQGRMLAFPNLLQQRVEPFSLKDVTKPGHHKIIALFLVNPERPILSTSHVSPQNKEWWMEEIDQRDAFKQLPNEVIDQIIGDVGLPITLEEAKEIRVELMEERRLDKQEDDRVQASISFSFDNL